MTRSEIARKGVAAAKWSALTTIGRFALQLVAQIMLARLLGPENYGVFGMALVVYTFSYFISTIGLSWSLIKLPEISEDDIRFAFTWQFIVALCVGASMFALAPWIAGVYFRDVRVQPVIQWMALACPLSAASVVAGALLQRAMQFKKSGLVQLVSYAIGYIAVGIPMALGGAGVYALVAAWLVQIAVATGGLYVMRPFSIRPLFVSANASKMVRMGATVFVTNMGNWLLNNLDRLMVGRYLNANAVGLYNAGYNLANIPNGLLVSALQPVFLAAGARVDDSGRLRSAFRQVLGGIIVLLTPIFVIPAVLSPEIIRVLYGVDWAEAAPVLSLLLIAMPAYVAWGMATPILWNTGRSHLEFLLQAPLLVLAFVAFVLLTSHGVFAASAVASVLILARAVVIVCAACRAVDLPVRVVLEWCCRGGLLAVVGGLVAYCPIYWTETLPALLRLLIAAMLSSSVLIGLVLVRPQVLGRDAIELLLRFVPKLEWVLLKHR